MQTAAPRLRLTALQHPGTMSGPLGSSLSEQMAALQKRVDRREKRRDMDRQQRAVSLPAMPAGYSCWYQYSSNRCQQGIVGSLMHWRICCSMVLRGGM